MRHEVPKDGLLIGRKEGCGLKLAGPTISAVQCRIGYRDADDVFELEDQSSNGTYINGRVLKKGQSAALVEGDLVQLTKRWHSNPALQFRFTRQPACEAHAAPEGHDEAQHRPAKAEAPEAVAAPASALPTLAPGAAVAAAARTSQTTTAEPPAIGGPRAASEGALLEAERAQLAAQRSVLEAELGSLHAAVERRRHEHGAATAIAEAVREERAGLEAELQTALGGLAQLHEQHEALQVRMEEALSEARAASRRLGEAQALTTGLEAACGAALADAGAARAAGAELTQRAAARDTAAATLRALAARLAEDMRSQAGALCESIQASARSGEAATPAAALRPLAPGRRSPARAPQASPLGGPAAEAEALLGFPGSRLFVRASAEPAGAPQRAALSELAGKENVVPISGGCDGGDGGSPPHRKRAARQGCTAARHGEDEVRAGAALGTKRFAGEGAEGGLDEASAKRFRPLSPVVARGRWSVAPAPRRSASGAIIIEDFGSPA